jgi:iron complex outermembrane receptor protein
LTGDTLSGNHLSRAPEWSATTAVDYTHALRGGGSWSARLEYNYRSDFFFTKENAPLLAQGSFGLLNVLMELETADRKWSFFASGRNLTAEDYFNQILLQSSPGYPDTYELGFRYRM